jgi:hypothetical protein
MKHTVVVGINKILVVVNFIVVELESTVLRTSKLKINNQLNLETIWHGNDNCRGRNLNPPPWESIGSLRLVIGLDLLIVSCLKKHFLKYFQFILFQNFQISQNHGNVQAWQRKKGRWSDCGFQLWNLVRNDFCNFFFEIENIFTTFFDVVFLQ